MDDKKKNLMKPLKESFSVNRKEQEPWTVTIENSDGTRQDLSQGVVETLADKSFSRHPRHDVCCRIMVQAQSFRP